MRGMDLRWEVFYRIFRQLFRWQPNKNQDQRRSETTPDNECTCGNDHPPNVSCKESQAEMLRQARASYKAKYDRVPPKLAGTHVEYKTVAEASMSEERNRNLDGAVNSITASLTSLPESSVSESSQRNQSLKIATYTQVSDSSVFSKPLNDLQEVEEDPYEMAPVPLTMSQHSSSKSNFQISQTDQQTVDELYEMTDQNTVRREVVEEIVVSCQGDRQLAMDRLMDVMVEGNTCTCEYDHHPNVTCQDFKNQMRTQNRASYKARFARPYLKNTSMLEYKRVTSAPNSRQDVDESSQNLDTNVAATSSPKSSRTDSSSSHYSVTMPVGHYSLPCQPATQVSAPPVFLDQPSTLENVKENVPVTMRTQSEMSPSKFQLRQMDENTVNALYEMMDKNVVSRAMVEDIVVSCQGDRQLALDRLMELL